MSVFYVGISAFGIFRYFFKVGIGVGITEHLPPCRGGSLKPQPTSLRPLAQAVSHRVNSRDVVVDFVANPSELLRETVYVKC